ncbi:hypothetical protein [Azospirillum palustre]
MRPVPSKRLAVFIRRPARQRRWRRTNRGLDARLSAVAAVLPTGAAAGGRPGHVSGILASATEASKPHSARYCG